MKCDLKLSDVQKLSGINIICMPKKKAKSVYTILRFQQDVELKKKKKESSPGIFFNWHRKYATYIFQS